jgi:DNA-binding SARP family transcriptional activator
LRRNEVVSSDRLTDELWGESPPATAAKSIQVYVSGLRKVLGEGRLTTRAPGYVLRAEPDEVDLAVFERLVGSARGAEPARASQILRSALALWRGPALGDLAYEPFAQADVDRLEELRLAALEQRIDADLACGRHAELVGELRGLVAASPLRERLRFQLMLALYRTGRQADALEAYRQARRELDEELGLEPGHDLQRLEHAILQHDPALDLPQPARGQRHPDGLPTPERSLFVAPRQLDGLAQLLRLAVPLAASKPPRELIVAGVVEPGRLPEASATLSGHRDELIQEGLAVRTAAFSSPDPGGDVVRLVRRENVDLLLVDLAGPPLGKEARGILEQAPCDVALLVQAGGALRGGPVVVPFGAAWHDWAALELGAWVARATGEPLRLIGADSAGRDDGRDASRVLADASLIVQRRAGVVAEPLLASAGRSGVFALAEGAGLLVVGLSERWQEEGLGALRTELAESPPAPTVLVRRAAAPEGSAPAEAPTTFGWSLTAGKA